MPPRRRCKFSAKKEAPNTLGLNAAIDTRAVALHERNKLWVQFTRVFCLIIVLIRFHYSESRVSLVQQ